MALKAIDKINKAKQEGKEQKIVQSDYPVDHYYSDLLKKSIKKMGRPPIYTPDELIQKCYEYAEYNESHPIYSEKAFGTGFIAREKRIRVLTISGFCVFAGIDTLTFADYETKPHFTSAITRVRDIFKMQKIEGAGSKELESNIIARELGMTDKQSISLESALNVTMQLPTNGRDKPDALPEKKNPE